DQQHRQIADHRNAVRQRQAVGAHRAAQHETQAEKRHRRAGTDNHRRQRVLHGVKAAVDDLLSGDGEDRQTVVHRQDGGRFSAVPSPFAALKEERGDRNRQNSDQDGGGQREEQYGPYAETKLASETVPILFGGQGTQGGED